LRVGASGIHLVNPINIFDFDFYFFHGAESKEFSGQSVKTKMPFPDSFINPARNPRARLKDAPSINGLLAAE
jgi:hypothetical protein